MKRLLIFILPMFLLLSACASYRSDVTSDEIVAAYEESGYTVSTHTYDEKLEYGVVGYIKAENSSGDYIYFSIFETEDEARAYHEEFNHPGAMSIMSVIFGEPGLHRWQHHGCFVVEYDDAEFYDVFLDLLK